MKADLGLRSGAARQHYDSEVNFYTKMADVVPLLTPEVYVARFDRNSERVLMIMESFADWHLPDQLEGATFWNADVRERFPWLRTLESTAFRTSFRSRAS